MTRPSAAQLVESGPAAGALPSPRGVCVLFVLLGAIVCIALVVGCSNKDTDDEHPLQERDGNATQTWGNLISLTNRVERYALYQRIPPNQVHLWTEVADAREIDALRADASENEQGIVRTMLQDAHLAVYYDPAIGQPIAVLPGETIDDAVRASLGGADPHNPQPTDDPQPTPPQDRSVNIPRVVVGTACLFTNEGKVVTLPVYRYGRSGGPVTQSTGLYIAVEGRAGDVAYYRLGATGRSYLLFADRDFR